jgi:hypothetical protein
MAKSSSSPFPAAPGLGANYESFLDLSLTENRINDDGLIVMQKHISRRSAMATIVLASSTALPGAVRGDEVKYVGGTISGLPQGVEGELEASDQTMLSFRCKKGSFDIPYDTIRTIEYGQKAGRRLGVAVLVNPVFLLSKKRKHFLTIGYKDSAGAQNGVVLELPKGMPKSMIMILEAKSGVRCEYESEEAKKHVHG